MIKMYGSHTVRLVNLMELPQTKTAIDKALSTYPLYNPVKTYDLIPTREELNTRLLNHYKYYEIGAETIGRFLDELKITMCEIMPYYNELFKTVEIMAELPNPFDNVDVVETIEETRTGRSTTSGTTSTTGHSENSDSVDVETTDKETATGDAMTSKTTKFSDTPQNNVNDIDGYLTNLTKEDVDETSESVIDKTGTSKSTQVGEVDTSTDGQTSSQGETTDTLTHTYTKKGNQGVNTYAHDMNEFRTSIIDVVNQIVNDRRIAELFLMVW